jgi:hypothetical protein
VRMRQIKWKEKRFISILDVWLKRETNACNCFITCKIRVKSASAQKKLDFVMMVGHSTDKLSME